MGTKQKIYVKHVGQDDWSRDIYKLIGTNVYLVSVDGVLHHMTNEGEPLYPFSKDIEVEITNQSEVH